MHGHQTNAVTALFKDRRLSGLAVFGLLAQLLDKSAERNPSLRFVTARKLGDVQHVRQHLLAAVLERKPHVRAGGFEQRRDGGRHRNVVPRTMQRLQELERLDRWGRNSAGTVSSGILNGWKWLN